MLLLTFLLVSVAWEQALPQAQSAAMQAYEQANQLFEKRENDKALAEYERAIALDSKNADFHVGRCRTLARLQRHKDAIAACSDALRLRPDDPMILRWRGHFHINLREFDDAIADLAKAESVKKDDRDIYYHLGLAHYLKGNWDQAATAFEDCLRNAKEDDDTVACSTWLYPSLRRRGGRDAEAARMLDRITPKMAVKENTAYLDRLLLFKRQKSEAEVAEAMKKDELSIPTVGYGIGLWHLLNGRKEQARSYFQQATSTGSLRTAFGFIASEVELKRMQ